MRKYLIFLFILLFVYFQSQENISDSANQKIANIEEVKINNKDYVRVEYSYGLKQEINYRLKSNNIDDNFEIGLKFKNKSKQKGRISSVTLFLHKTDKNAKLTNLQLNFYKVDSLTGEPKDKIVNESIIYKPNSRKRGNVKINVLDYNIPFPENGVIVTVKLLKIPSEKSDVLVGPSLRLTNYSERLTYTRYNNDPTKWGNSFNFSKKSGIYTNVMLGMDVYIKKRKNVEE